MTLLLSPRSAVCHATETPYNYSTLAVGIVCGKADGNGESMIPSRLSLGDNKARPADRESEQNRARPKNKSMINKGFDDHPDSSSS